MGADNGSLPTGKSTIRTLRGSIDCAISEFGTKCALMNKKSLATFINALLASTLAVSTELPLFAQGTDPDLLPPEVVLPAPGAPAYSTQQSAAAGGTQTAALGMSMGAATGAGQETPIQAFVPAGWPFDGMPAPGGVSLGARDFASFYNNLPPQMRQQMGNQVPGMQAGSGLSPVGGGNPAMNPAAAPAAASSPESADASSTTVEANDPHAAGPFSTSGGKDCPLCKKKAAEEAARKAQAAAAAQDATPKPDPVAVIQTTKGPITIRLFRQYAPQTVANFIELAQKGFYNNLTWHRVVPGFVIQAGCPKGDGTGGYTDPQTGRPRTLPLELHQKLRHNAPGVVAMARFGNDLNSASSQFYITQAPQPNLDNKYTVFGGVLNGMEVVQHITQQDRILGINLQGI